MVTIKGLRKELDECKRPLFFFHDDSDGLCSFLLLYRYKQEGKGIVVKSSTGVDLSMARKVDEYNPDKIFITDMAIVSDEFLDEVKQPIVWIDHHPLDEDFDYSRAIYYNPRQKNKDENIPATKLCYDIVKQDEWVAATGVVGDWVFLPFLKKFAKENPKLLSPKINTPEEALYSSQIGNLSRILNFVLREKVSEVNKCVKILTRVKDPEEILEQTTSAGKFIYKKYLNLAKTYQKLIKRAVDHAGDEKMIVFTYHENNSFTGDLANELLYKFSTKVIIVAREKSGWMRCSLRSPKNISMRKLLENSLSDIPEGGGGGHEHACGASVRTEYWEQFLENMKNNI